MMSQLAQNGSQKWAKMYSPRSFQNKSLSSGDGDADNDFLYHDHDDVNEDPSPIEAVVDDGHFRNG